MAEKFVADASKVVSLQLVKTATDVDNRSLAFAPEFCHQFFGEHETIFGYEDLKVTLLCTFCGCQVYLRIKYKEACVAADFANVEPDDILNCIQKLYPEHAMLLDYDNFLRAIENQHTFEPYGQLLHVYSTDRDDDSLFQSCQFSKLSHILGFKVNRFPGCYTLCRGFFLSTPVIPNFVFSINLLMMNNHRNLNLKEFFLEENYENNIKLKLWFMVVSWYERYLDSSKRVCYGFVGYSSVYLYYAYPEHLKPRIGHFLILPPFQKSGHGFHLLQAIYNDLVPDAKVLEIAAEDPALNFVKLRDYVDATNCQKLRSFTPIESLKINGFSKELADEARSKLKIVKKQARRIYEILRLMATNTADPGEYKAYRLDVKRRLYKPFKKSRKDWKNLDKVLTPEEAASTAVSMTRENIHLALQSAFEQTVDEYRPVLDRLATYHLLPDIVLARTSDSSNHDCASKNGHTA